MQRMRLENPDFVVLTSKSQVGTPMCLRGRFAVGELAWQRQLLSDRFLNHPRQFAARLIQFPKWTSAAGLCHSCPRTAFRRLLRAMIIAVTATKLPSRLALTERPSISKSGTCLLMISKTSSSNPSSARPIALTGNSQGNSSSDLPFVSGLSMDYSNQSSTVS